MKFKIDRGLVPIKAHFFFFFAGLGPILPQLNVFGRQLGVSPGVMGLVTAVLPLLWAAAKPLFGYVVDFWPNHRKLVFMLLIATMTGSYCCLWFLPMPDPPHTTEPQIIPYIYNLNDTIYLREYDKNPYLEKYTCRWNCSIDDKFDFYLSNSSFVNTVYVDGSVSNNTCSLLHMTFDDVRMGHVTCVPVKDCNLLCYEDVIDVNRTKREVNSVLGVNNIDVSKADSLEANKVNGVNKVSDNNASSKKEEDVDKRNLNDSNVVKKDETNLEDSNNITNHINVNETAVDLEVTEDKLETKDSFYMTGVFWAFVVLMCVGTVAFNVANCIGDAVCFDVLGPERGSKYGAQRAWGTAGYGITALLGGWLIDAVSGNGVKDFTPAFIVALVATGIDLVSCRALTLPSLTSPDDSGKALRDVLRIPRVLVFITFAVVAGTFDSFIIYYMFWFLEEMAEETGHMAKIKLIEGVVVAGQSFLGELLFFYFSGRIIKRWGYGTTLTFSLMCYGVRMALISFIRNPWHLVFIESVMQGPTYALCYATIVGYAAHVAPEGYSATVQGIVAGMDDGVGFALGSLVGGQLYAWAGGRGSFRILAVTAVIGSLAHAALFAFVTRADRDKEKQLQQETPEEGEKMLPPVHSGAIYQDTVVSLKSEKGDAL